MPEFRCELKKYRQLKNLTQEQLGQMVGVRGKPSCAWKLENITLR